MRIRTASTRTSTITAKPSAKVPMASLSTGTAATLPGSTASGRKFRLGVMGGTFDPIHHGHLVAASEVAAVFDLDEVVFVPTGQPWQKSHREVSPAEDRYLMTVIATASNPRFSVRDRKSTRLNSSH